MTAYITQAPEGRVLHAYGVTTVLPSRQAPDLDADQMREIERAVVDAVSARQEQVDSCPSPRKARARSDHGQVEDLAMDLLAAASQGLRAAPAPDVYRADLADMADSIILSRGAVISSQPYEIASLVIASTLDVVRSWRAMGDWTSRKRSAAEVVAWLIEEEGLTVSYAQDRELLERLVKETGQHLHPSCPPSSAAA